VTIRSDDGEFAVHCFHEVLANELARIAPKVGDRIGIKYSGKDRDGGYHRYRARGEGAGAFRWSEFGDTDDVSTDFADPSAGGEPDDGLPF
jgi:hypothetical protein